MGQAYEDFFVEVMTLGDPDFRPVKPQGSLGDKKNDGFSGPNGKYFQVYAPEDLESNITKAEKKLETDFKGLLEFWNSLSPVQEFYYVLNDRFQGAYPTIEAQLLKLKQTHGLRECRPFLNSDLMRAIRNLADRELIRLVGQLPSPEDIADLDYGVFTDVLRHVISNGKPISPDAILRVPDFKEKLHLNKISSNVAALFESGNLQSGAVEGFFASHGDFSKMAIRDRLAQLYIEARENLRSGTTQGALQGDLIFFALLDRLSPRPLTKHTQDAAIVLMSYFFETCDIYEDPSLF